MRKYEDTMMVVNVSTGLYFLNHARRRSMAIEAPEHPEIAADLREAQGKKGYSNARLARLSGISRKHLDEVLKGSNVSVRILKKVMAALQMEHISLGEMAASGGLQGVSPDVLLAIADEMEQVVAPLSQLIGTLRAYAQGEASPELNLKVRETIRKGAADPTTKELARKADRRKQ